MQMRGKDLHFSVKGRGEFPVDMLRYDGCRAASPRDQDLIDLHSDAFVDGEHEIEVSLVIPNASSQLPHDERWASFKWPVVGVVAIPDDRERIARLDMTWQGLLAKLSPEEREAMDYFRPKRCV